MSHLLTFYGSLSLADQFQWGAACAVCLMLMVIAAIVCGPSIIGAAQLMHRELFGPELEDEEAKLVASRQRRRELDAAIAHQIHADSLDRRRLAEMLATMPSPKNAQTRIH